MKDKSEIIRLRNYEGLSEKEISRRLGFSRITIHRITSEYTKALKEQEGKEFIIMGKNTYSAAYDFCEQAKWSKVGELVGEEPGQRSPYAGNAKEDRLPNSKIAFRYATATYEWTVPDLPKKDGFLQPDIPYDLSMPLEMKDYKEIIRLSDELNSYR